MYLEDSNYDLDVTNFNLQDGTAVITCSSSKNDISTEFEYHIDFECDPKANSFKYLGHNYYGYWSAFDAGVMSEIKSSLKKTLVEYLQDNGYLKSSNDFEAEVDLNSTYTLTLIKRKTRNYVVKVIRESTQIEGEIVQSLCEGDKDLLINFVRPLNSLLLMYKSNVSNLDERVCIRLLSRYIEELKKLLSISIDSPITMANLSNMNESKLINFYVNNSIASTMSQNINSLIKPLLTKIVMNEANESFLHVREVTTSRFDLTKFKLDHPKLYTDYTIQTSNLNLTQRRNKNTKLPIDPQSINNIYANLFNFLFKDIDTE